MLWLLVLVMLLLGAAPYVLFHARPARALTVFVVLATAGAFWAVLLPILAALSSTVWIRTETTRVDVTGPWMGDMSTEYDYVLDGQAHADTRYGFIPPEEYMNHDELLAIQGHQREYAVCYVAPWNHDSAVLVRSLPLRAFTWRAPWLIAVAVLYFARRQSRRRRSR